jgi:hypothetical protein
VDWDSLRLTSATFWQSALFSALIAAAGVFVLARLIDRASFRRLKWPVVISSVIFWSALGTLLIQLTWESYYQRFAPAWMHNGGSLIITIPLAAAQALVFHWAALRLPLHPVAGFCLLGGLEALLEHLWGIYGWKIMEIPMLQGVDPLSVLAFAFPEYMLYWCAVIAAAALFHRGWQRARAKGKRKAI